MSRPNILLLGKLPEWVEGSLGQMAIVHRIYDAPEIATFMDQIGPTIQCVVTRGDIGASAEVITACPALEIISIFGVGYDAVDLDMCRTRGIKITNTPDVLTDDCADLALGMWLALSRGVVLADGYVRSGAWAAQGDFPVQHRASGLRAGILGAGRIGKAIGRRLAGFDVEIAYSARGPQRDLSWQFFANVQELAGWADVLFVALAATPDTRHMVDENVLNALGPQGVLVNISRAQNIDEEALIRALEAGTIRGAALDVFEGEPHLDPRFINLSNVLLQPHHASAPSLTLPTCFP